jgi:hypothetical protein
MDAEPAQIPREQLPITLFDGVVLAVRAADGQIDLVVRDLCTALDLIPSSQLRAIRADDRLHLVSFRLRIERQVRTLDCLLLDDIPLWLIKVRPPRDNARAAERLRYVQDYLLASVRSAFAALTGLPDAPSNQIEDSRSWMLSIHRSGATRPGRATGADGGQPGARPRGLADAHATGRAAPQQATFT